MAKKPDISNEEQERDRELEEAMQFSRFATEEHDAEEEEALSFTMGSKAEEAEEEEAEEDEEAAAASTEEAEEISTTSAEEGEEETEEGAPATPEKIYTLPNGQKVKASEVTQELLDKAFGGWNAQSHHADLLQRSQQQLEEAKTAINELRQRQQLVDMAVQQQMLQQRQQQQMQRPPAKDLHPRYAGYVQQLVADGRINEDQAAEHANLLAEYAFDQQLTRAGIDSVAVWAADQIAGIRRELGLMAPKTQELEQEAIQVRRRNIEMQVQAEVSKQEGYESLSDPAEWQKLKDFVIQDIQASRDASGNPTYSPSFSPQMLMHAYDAMMAPVWRAGSSKATKQAKEDERIAVRRASGTPVSKAGKKPGGKQPPRPKTPEEEAMDFSDPRRAMG